jgi:F-type H+-transporting ATPase subunit b
MEHHNSLLAEPRFWVAIAFFIFFGVFGKKLWSALAAMLDKRADKIRGELAEATRLRAEAETMLREAQAGRDAALKDAQSLLESARHEAAKLGAAARADAETAAARMVLAKVAANHDPLLIDQAIAGLPKALASKAA